MALINPYTRYKPISSSRRGKTNLPPIRIIVLTLLILGGAISLKTYLLNSFGFLKGIKYWKQGELELARREFNKVLDRSPGNATAVDGLGLVELKAGHLDKAQELYKRATEMGLKYNRRFSHLKTGQSLIDEGRYTEAELELVHALEIQPKEADIHLAMGTVYRAQGQVAKGLKEYETALALDPKGRKGSVLLEQAREERDRGSVYYIYDRNGQPLALEWLKNGEKGYPQGKEFAHLIGYVDRTPDPKNNRGSMGLEKVYQEYFPGNKLYLTIDARIQRIISKAMGWYKGAVVVLDPRTGEILGCVSQPTFTPENIRTGWWSYVANPNQPFKNRAFESLYEPGSIIKIITSAAAVEKQLDFSRIFPLNCRGSIHIDGRPFMDWQRHKTVRSLDDAFDLSCNVAFAMLGFELGAETLLEFNNRFGFNTPLPSLPIPYVQSVSPKLGLTRYELAETSTGLGKDFRITPLGGAMIASVIANDGVLMSPYLVMKLTNINGKPLIEHKPTILKNAISRQTARYLTTTMLNDVERGIGVKARVTGLKTAGKTGTSGSRNPNFHAWFICFSPVENPRVAIAVIAEHGGTGKDVAAPIAGKILQGIRENTDWLEIKQSK